MVVQATNLLSIDVESEISERSIAMKVGRSMIPYALCIFLNTTNVKDVSYTVIDLGSLGGSAFAHAINKKGQVVGYSFTGSGNRAFLWENGVMTDLGLLSEGEFHDSYATAINDSGQITGYSHAADGSFQAFLYSDGKMSPLYEIDALSSNGSGINKKGEITGTASGVATEPPYTSAFLWKEGSVEYVGTLGGTFSIGYGINDSGMVVGYSHMPPIGGIHHAFLWDSGTITDLGTLGGSNSRARAVNDRGQVVGYSAIAGDLFSHAFLWDNGAMQDLGTLYGSSHAYGINNKTQVVGSSETAFGYKTACVWQEGYIIDLNTVIPAGSGPHLSEARGINDRGQIVAHADAGGAFLLTPVH